MRVAVLGALLVSKDWRNGLALALTLPLFSFAVSGHPVFPKFLLIAAELSVNVLLFVWLSRVFGRRFGSRVAVGAAAFLSILLSKVLYYGLKALVLTAGLMQSELVATALWAQLAVAVLLSHASRHYHLKVARLPIPPPLQLLSIHNPLFPVHNQHSILACSGCSPMLIPVSQLRAEIMPFL